MLARSCPRGPRALTAVAALVASTQVGCGPRRGPATAGAAPDAPAPTEPLDPRCLTHARAELVLEPLRASVAPDTPADALRLVSSSCRKRVYVAGRARFVVWTVGDHMHARGASTTSPLPTAPCIDRALALARQLVPFADTILQREAAQNPELWRDPDVGAVSYLECDAADQPTFTSIETMLHETNHRVSPGACIFDFRADRDVCFALPATLPLAALGAYDRPPAPLDAAATRAFDFLQTLYLERNAQDLLELLDEVMAYSVSAEVLAAGATRKLYPRPGVTTFNNLPLMMALAARYADQLAVRDPALAARELGPGGRNHDAFIAVLDRAEASYQIWCQAVGTPGLFERTFWDDYQRRRQAWLAPGSPP